MLTQKKIEESLPLVKAWRRDIHAHPETAFEEHRTSSLVSNILRELGMEVTTGIGGTGVVGTLKRGGGDKIIGIRADMDALFIQEENNFAHRSTIPGKSHACGHDGHTAMALGAAKYLAEQGSFNGTVRFIFQPAEETGDERCGGNVMIQDGLFERFPVDCIFAMHNAPGMPLGHFSVRAGAMLASIDTFEFKLQSMHSHPGGQHPTPDPILVAARAIEAFHSYKARHIDPAEAVVLSITQIQAGDPINDRQGVHITPEEVYIRGTVYTFNDAIRDQLQTELEKIVRHLSDLEGTQHSFTYERGYPVLINNKAETEFAINVARNTVGYENVQVDMSPIVGAEDFAFMLRETPGCYLMIGNGLEGEGIACHNPVHSTTYDFNDETSTTGVAFWVNLVESYLD